MNKIQMEATKQYVKSLLFEAVRGKTPDEVYEIMNKAIYDTDINGEAYEILTAIELSIFNLKNY